MATDCTTCCDDLQCEVDAIKLNQTQLFTRTDDIAAFLENLNEDGTHVYRVVHNADELNQALALGGQIYVDAPIVDALNPFIVTVDGTEIIGMNEDAAIIRQHNNTSAISVLIIEAKNVKIRNLKITSNHPKVNNTTIHDIAVELSDSHDVSGFVIEKCEIFDSYHGIYRHWVNDSNPYAPKSINVKIKDNYIHSLVGFGIYIQQNVDYLDVINNVLIGEVASQDTHESEGNAIWVGNNSDFALFAFNRITRWGRHGIEYWNSQAIPVDYTLGNRSSAIIYNSVYGLINHTGSALQNFCISAFGNTSLDVSHNTCLGGDIGIELYNDAVTDGEILCSYNYIDGASNQLLSVNGLKNGRITNNTLKNSDSIHGMQILNGCRNTTIKANKFYDAGERTIYINGFALTINAIQTVNNGWITVDQDLGGGGVYTWTVGKEISFKNIVGTTQLNNNHYTITAIDRSGAVGTHKIRIGIDMSGFTPYVSGGTVIESYRNLIIDSNEFYFTQEINGAAVLQSMYLTYTNQAVVRNNVTWHVDTVTASYYCVGFCSLLVDVAGAAVTADANFTGDNRVISYKASN